MRNEGGGFAANIYGAMPEGSIQVTWHPGSLATNPWLLIPAFKLLAVTPEPINLP